MKIKYKVELKKIKKYQKSSNIIKINQQTIKNIRNKYNKPGNNQIY